MSVSDASVERPPDALRWLALYLATYADRWSTVIALHQAVTSQFPSSQDVIGLIGSAAPQLLARLEDNARQTTAQKDMLLHVSTQPGLESLRMETAPDIAHARELWRRLHAGDGASRALLEARYGRQLHGEALGQHLGVAASELAGRLCRTRSQLDWLDAPGEWTITSSERLLPSLIEDYLGGTIDQDSQHLLSASLNRDLGNLARFQRQWRLHLMLTAAFVQLPFTPVRNLSEQGSSRTVVMPDAAPSPRTPTRHGSSHERQSARFPAPHPSSPIPMLLVGAAVLVGALLLFLLNRDAPRPAEQPVRVESSAITTTQSGGTTPASPGSSVLRPDFGGGAAVRVPAGDGAVAVTFTGDALKGFSYAHEPLRLAVTITRPDLVAAVEYRIGDRLLATMTRPPFVWDWRDPLPVAGDLSARVTAKDGSHLSTTMVPLRIVTAHATGMILREWWNGIGGRTVAEGRKVAGYPDRPTGTTFDSAFDSQRNWSDTYLQRMRGYLIPPADGEYTFWIVGDDEAELWLSGDETRAGLRRIAQCPATEKSAVGYGRWDERPQQRSAPVMLKAGLRYYVEALHKENGGNDHVAVGWQLPDGTQERPIPGRHLSLPEIPDDGIPVFAQGFEDGKIGAAPTDFLLNLDSAVPAATARLVAGDAMEGGRYLAIAEVPGQQHSWTPEVCRPVDHTAGRMRMTFALRVRPGGAIIHAWRQKAPDRSFVTGPSLNVEGSGTISVAGREVTRVTPGTWVRLTITAGLGPLADGTWTLVVQAQGGQPQEFTKLTCDKKFARLTWLGFSSLGKSDSVADLDDLTMRLLP